MAEKPAQIRRIVEPVSPPSPAHGEQGPSEREKKRLIAIASANRQSGQPNFSPFAKQVLAAVIADVKKAGQQPAMREKEQQPIQEKKKLPKSVQDAVKRIMRPK